MSAASNEFLHIWKSYNETNSQFLETYRSIQTRTNTVGASNARTSNRRTNHAETSTSTTTASWLQQLLSSGRSPYISDISYSWVFEVPTSSTTTSQSRLTHKQIQDNTRTFVYNENDTNLLLTTTCPISHNDFQTGDILCEINSCKHVFMQGEILRWFDVNVSCPICRTPVASTSTTNQEPVSANQSHILDEIILTPLFQPSSSSSTSNTGIPEETDQMTQIMNEALESIFSGRTSR